MELARIVSLLALHFLKRVSAIKLELVELPCLAHTTRNEDCLARPCVATLPVLNRKFIAIVDRHLQDLMTRRQPLVTQIFNWELLDLELRHVHLKDFGCAAIVGGEEHSLCTVEWP